MKFEDAARHQPFGPECPDDRAGLIAVCAACLWRRTYRRALLATADLSSPIVMELIEDLSE